MRTTTVARTQPHGRVVAASRPQDALYDKLYTAACTKDRARALAQAGATNTAIQPSYENMFSELVHFPRQATVVRQSHTTAQALQQLASQPQHGRDAHGQISGGDLLNYLRQPNALYNPAARYVYARHAPDARLAGNAAAAAANIPVETSRTIAVQTMYREQEAQTVPCTLPHVVRPSSSASGPPEILALATLTYGAGLPAGLAEVEMIERARAKRAWEATLPDATDPASFEKRVRMMEQMELQEWEEREREIQRLQDARLELLQQIISRREQEMEESNRDRLQKLWQRRLQEKERLTERIERKRRLHQRKLVAQRANAERPSPARDIIAEYTNRASPAYLPRLRDGTAASNQGAVAAAIVQPQVDLLLGALDALEGLEGDLPQRYITTSGELPSHDESSNPAARRDAQVRAQLRQMQQKIDDNKAHVREQERPLRFVVRVRKTVERPPTPSLVTAAETGLDEPLLPPSLISAGGAAELKQLSQVRQSELEQAALLLQRVLRGRTAQVLMFQGKERRLQLIKELRTRHALARAAQSALDDINATSAPAETAQTASGATQTAVVPGIHVRIDRLNAESLDVLASGYQVESDVQPIHAAARAATPGSAADPSTDALQQEQKYESIIQAEFVGQQLDFYTKEIVRLREQRRIAAIVKLAERTRRMREAAESGLRQAELKRRAHEDAVFQQVMGVHTDTVDAFLEDLVASSIDATSTILARERARQYATRINAVVDDIQERERYGHDTSVEVVSDLVSSFLIPEVQRETLRSQISREQQRFAISGAQTMDAVQEAMGALLLSEFGAGETSPVLPVDGVSEDEEESAGV